MDYLGKLKGRDLFYLSFQNNPFWFRELPSENWLVAPIGYSKSIKGYIEIACHCLNRKVSYVCILGNSSEIIHDIFDEEIAMKAIDQDSNTDKSKKFNCQPMTTWHDDFEEGVWFSIDVAEIENDQIKSVVFIDTTDFGVLDNLKNAIKSIIKFTHE